MATDTTEHDVSRETPQPKRKGPLSPEEMIDVRQQALEVDEAMVQRLVAEARADYGVNLLEPFQANQHPYEVMRHKRRLIRVLGATARAKSGLKNIFTVGLPAVLIFGALWYNDTMPPLADLFFAVIFGALIGVLAYYFNAFPEAFAKAYAVERRDFTDPGYVTGLCRTYLPRLTMYNRPEVWRGNNGHNGIAHKDSFIVVATGLDTVHWTYDEANPPALDDPLWDADEWCTVERGALIKDFRTPLDYYDLPQDTHMTDTISMKHRRAWCRELQRLGEAFEAWEKGALGLLDGKWVWLAGGGLFVAGLILIIFAME